jgi:hypothetical protein
VYVHFLIWIVDLQLSETIIICSTSAAAVMDTTLSSQSLWRFLVPFFVGVLADEAENIAAAHDDVLLAKILDKEECEALKMGAYLGVAAASTNPPKFIHLRYTPPSGDVKTKLAVVGKGLTFDRCIIQHMTCITLLLSNG